MQKKALNSLAQWLNLGEYILAIGPLKTPLKWLKLKDQRILKGMSKDLTVILDI